jgi:5-methylcytosine-specific restriction endonuclease McrA
MPASATGTSVYLNLRAKLIQRGPLICVYCGIDLDPDAPRHTPHAIELDHIKPRASGGTDTEDNLALACWSCNRTKWHKAIEPSPPKKKMLTTRQW